jgi:DNA-binding NarL/FixJ family response regulator
MGVMMVNLLIATDAECFAEILKSYLSSVSVFRIGIVKDKDSLVNELKTGKPYYVFLESNFAGAITDEFTQTILKKHPRLRIAVWTVAKIFPEIAARFIAAGAETYFTMRQKKDELNGIIGKILAGDYYLPDDVDEVLSRDNFDPVVGADFTGKERQVIRLTLLRKRIKVIAETMGVTESAIKYHKKNIYRKCGAGSNVDLLFYALDRGVITFEEYTAYKEG